MSSWKKYYDIVGDNPNRLVKEVIRRHRGRKHLALDLGAGNLRDSKFLLASGFRKVIAVERDPEAELFFDTRIPLYVMPIERFRIVDGAYDLIYSCNVLFFLDKELIENLFQNAWRGLRPGGIFACNVFGERDGWVQPSEVNPRTYITAADAGRLRTGFQMLLCREQEDDGETTNGVMKHWHQWIFILQKHAV
jgi:SAM-dependent methyltransferase